MSKILVVDDSPTMRNLVKAALQVQGYSIATAEDGLQALDKFEEFGPDLVIADINMPRMNGIEMITRIRETKNKDQMPIVVLTTETSDTVKNDIRTAGANAWIAKPFADDVLCNVVRQFAG